MNLILLLALASIVLILSKKKLRFSLLEILCLALCIVFLIINFKYNLNIFNQEISLIILGVVFTPLTALGFWYFLGNKEVDLLVECVATIGLYVILLCSSILFIINLIVLLAIAIYAFKYYTKKVDFFKRILFFVFGFGLISVFWFLKLGNNEVKAFSNMGIADNTFNFEKMPLAMIVFPFNIFGVACLLNKEKLRQNIIVMIFAIFYILIGFVNYIYAPLFNSLIIVFHELGLVLWIKIFFSLFSIMGILRFNRLINKLHTKRLSILVLVLIIPLLFFNFKYLKAFYDDIKTNTKELTFEVKNLDGKDIQEKQDKLKVALADKKKEIEGKIEKQNMDMQINDYIVDNNSKENDLVYSSNQFSILVDDRLFWNDLNSKAKSEEILKKLGTQVVLLRSNEIAKIAELEPSVKYIVIGEVEKEISNKYFDKIVELQNIDNLVKTDNGRTELEYTMINKNNIEIAKAENKKPIIFNYKYDKNWKGYQDGKLLNKYFVLPDKMMFLPKTESKVNIKMKDNTLVLPGLIGLVGVMITSIIVIKRKDK